MEFRKDIDTHKTRMNGLSCGKEIMTIRSAVLIQCQRVTVYSIQVVPKMDCIATNGDNRNAVKRFAF